MEYFKLCHECQNGTFIDGDVSFQPEISGYYQNGTTLLPEEVKVSVVLDKSLEDIDADFFMTSVGAFFVSQNLKEIIENFQSNLRLVKAEVSYHNGYPTICEYYLMHAVNQVYCFDYIESEYSGKGLILEKIRKKELQDGYQIRGVKKLSIDKSKVGGDDIFFIGGVIWLDPIVTRALANEILLRDLNVRCSVVV